MKLNNTVTTSPHIKQADGISSVMLDVIIALVPSALGAIFFFGIKALLILVTCITSCVLAEYFWCRIFKKPITTGDLSAVVTALLLAYSLPPQTPLWVVMIGAVFSIIVVKQLFGGLGHNFMNPALCGRAFLMASWPAYMTSWTTPTAFGADAVSTATPLATLASGNWQDLPLLSDMFFGNRSGCIGETSAVLILLGGIYLIVRNVMDWKIPFFYILTSFVLGFFLGGGTAMQSLMTATVHIITGGILLGAIFMATDYTTSPVTPLGHIIMGVGCGLITSLIRFCGGYAEGVTYAILIMNALTPLIDRYIRPRTFGHFPEKKEAEVNA